MLTRFIVTLLLAGSLLAQSQVQKTKPAQAKPKSSSTTASSGVDTIIELVQAKMSEGLILKTLQKEGKAYSLSAADMLKLQKAGASEAIIQGMMDPSSISLSAPATPAASAAPAAPVVPATPAAPPAEAAKPAVKRVGVLATGTNSESVVGDLVSLLRGDGSILDVVPITNKIDVYREAEMKQKGCNYLLEVAFETKAKSNSGLSSFLDLAKTVNRESGSFSNDRSRVSEVDQKTTSADNIQKKLSLKGKDKVKISYKLTGLEGKQTLAENQQEVQADGLKPFLESAANELVKKIIQ